MIRTLMMIAVAGTLVTSCEKSKKTAGIYKGPEAGMGHGKGYAWVKLNDDAKPVSLGITLSTQVLQDLEDHAGGGPGHEMAELILELPAEAGSTPFKNAVVNWNPEGHEPPGIYDVPHYDFHFYTIPTQERKQIPPYEVDSAKFKNSPAADYLPANYMNFGGGVPQMGAHWLDVTSPELHGQPFRETFIYGSFNGGVVFLETMVEENYFKQAVVSRAIPRPAKVKTAGYYPKNYRIVKEGNSYSIIFDNMEWRDAN